MSVKTIIEFDGKGRQVVSKKNTVPDTVVSRESAVGFVHVKAGKVVRRIEHDGGAVTLTMVGGVDLPVKIFK